MRKVLLPVVCLVYFLATTTLLADNSNEHMFDTKFSGYTYINAGEVVKGTGYQTTIYDHQWLSDACVGIFATTRIDEHLKVLMGFEGQLSYSFNRILNNDPKFLPLRNPINSFWVSQGEGIYSFGDPSKISLQVEAGYFPYKYNPEVRNLGEYLFRTTCYPTVMFNNFDRTFTELMGFRVGNTIGGIFHQDLIINSETKQYPFYDFSLSYLADFKTPGTSVKPSFFTVGGGIQFYRLIPIQGDLTNVHDPNPGYNGARNEVFNTIIDPVTNDTTFTHKEWIGFGGTKLMGRATLDFKSIFPQFIIDLMGKEDLKLYGEIAVLGLKNYDRYYNNITNRMPIALGINWPTFKVLDILNTEIEYLNSPYGNDDYFPMNEMIPVPNPIVGIDSLHTKLKWSVYAKKTFGNMSLMVQVANDHFIPKSAYPAQPVQDYRDVTFRKGDWWWNFRARFDF